MFAPAAASSVAIPSPMPLVDPVTSAVLPEIPMLSLTTTDHAGQAFFGFDARPCRRSGAGPSDKHANYGGCHALLIKPAGIKAR